MDVLKFNELLARVKEEEASLIALFKYYSPRIVMHIERKYPGVPADDVVQEFFLFLIKRKLPMFVANPNAWVYTVCDNLAKRYILANNRVLIQDEAEETDCLSILDNLIEKEFIKQLFDCIEDGDTKKIIYYIYWIGYNSKEISVILGIKQSTVRQKHNRAIKKLKNFPFDVTLG